MRNPPNDIMRRVKTAVLSMLEESDTLDYAVIHTPNKDSATINVSRCDSPSVAVQMRVILSQTTSMLAVAVKEGKTQNVLMENTYLGGVDSPRLEEKVLATITDFIETLDNGGSLTGSPPRKRA